MQVGRALNTIATGVGILVVVALLFGQLFGQPILFGYVATGSMAPTMEAGDGFVAVPAFVAGPPEVGDVVVYDAETLHDGGLTTHRIVGKTEGGYITKGDANPFTDQSGGEPPVDREQIVAYALQVGGHVVVIPHLGTAIEAVRTIVAAPFGLLGSKQAGTVLVAAGIALFVLAGAMDGDKRRPADRTRSRRNVVAAWVIVLFAAVVVTSAATAAMVVPSGTQTVEVVSTNDPTDNPLVLAPGQRTTIPYSVTNGGIVPTLVMIESANDRVTAIPSRTVVGHGEVVEVTLSLSAPTNTGAYRYSVRESRYLLVLPPSVLIALHRVHPLAAILAVDVVIASFVVAASTVVFGTGYLRLRPSPTHVPFRIRVRRRLRGWL